LCVGKYVSPEPGNGAWGSEETWRPLVSLTINPSTLLTYSGESFKINMTLYNVTELYLWVFSLRWNPAALEFINITEGDFLARGGTTTGVVIKSLNQTDGYLDEATCSLLGNVPGVSGNGTLATLAFKALRGGYSPLDVYFDDLVDSNGNSIQCNVVNGNVNVAAADLSVKQLSLPYPQIAKYANMTIPMNLTIQNTGLVDAGAFNVSFTAYWNSGGLIEYSEKQRVTGLGVNMTTMLNFYFAPLHLGNYTLTFNVDSDNNIIESNKTNNELIFTIKVNVPGDINGDGQVDYKDLFLLAKAYWSTPTDPNWNPNADINYDGTVNYKDLFLLLRNYSS
jgi:hypothetical protein